VCNDDTGFVCGTRATLNSHHPRGRGPAHPHRRRLHGAGAYQVRYVLGACTTGQTRCGTCVDTQTDNNNCGGCNRQCATGQFCRARRLRGTPPPTTPAPAPR
jgi:hypothetical protein